MKYDYHCHFENFEEGIRLAKSLGLNGICLTLNWTNESEFGKFFEKVQPLKTKDFDIVISVEIEGKPNHIRELAKRLRQNVEIIAVHGGDSEVNRLAVETPEVDILLHPELKREDPGFDHIMAKLARENNVAVEFSMSDLVYTYKKARADILKNLLHNAKLVRKFKVPFVLTSGAFSEWNLRAPSELISFGRVLGFSDPQIQKALSDNIIKENRKRLDKKFVMPGVEVVE